MARLHVSPNARAVAVLLVATIAAGVASSLAGPHALTASVFVAAGPRGAAVHTELDPGPSPESVERLGQNTGADAPRITWDGFLHSDESREYELGLFTNGPARVFLDGRMVLDSPNGTDLSPEKFQLSRGQHLFSLEYVQDEPRSALALRWDVGNPYRLDAIPSAAYSPRAMSEWRWRLRRIAPTLVGAVATVWSGLLIWLGWRAVRRLLPDRGVSAPSPPLSIVLALFTVLFAVGIDWGWPATWAPDELDPLSILNAIGHRFSHGWFDKYPPLHYYLLGIVYVPVLIAGELGWLVVDSEPVRGLLYLQGRVLTVAMGLGTLLGVALLGTRTLGEKYAWPAALCAGAFMPFVFYAKTVNVDVPYVFWFVLSCLFLVEAHRHGRARDCIGFAVTAAAAVATKDQAYALYILPALHLAWRIGRSRQGIVALASGTVAGILVLALVHNVAFNYDGFRSHVDLVVGPASAGYRMFPTTVAGEWALAKVTAGQLLWTLGVPGMLLVLIGVVPRLRGPDAPAVPAWVFLAALSYYVTLIAVIGYVYDRFLLPVTTVLALAAAIGLVRLAELRVGRGFSPANPPALKGRPTFGIAASVLVGWLLWRVISVDALLVRDSRYAAEAWLRAHVPRDAWVVSVDEFGYVPRLDRFRHKQIQATIADTLSNNPDFIVVNTEFLARSPDQSPTRLWLDWLQAENGLFEAVYRYKAPLGWSALAWQTRFTDRREDDFTNIDKANPEIVIFKRRPEKAPGERSGEQRPGLGVNCASAACAERVAADRLP
ncbi:MAG TPA: glycosyltransferase family 39 protein [Vicinamibacterales bacterium]|nr:glycosyltransferase family 39 protein [Vicinamibacterales bacterium]